MSVSVAHANLVVNGTFDADSGWTKIGTVQISGSATFGAYGNNRGAVCQVINTVSGKWYSVTFDKGHGGDNDNSGLMVSAYNATWNNIAEAFWGASHWGTDRSPITHYFQAKGAKTTILFCDFNYDGASHDVRVDNVVVEQIDKFVGSINIANRGTITQSSISHPGSYPPERATDGVPLGAADGDNFMHTATTASDWLDLTFDREYHVDRVAVSSRPGYENRMGDKWYLYDGENNLVTTITPVDGHYYDEDNRGSGWAGVKRVRIWEGPGSPVNFSELEVYATDPDAPNLVVNGKFDTDSDWTKVGRVEIKYGGMILGGGGNYRGAVYQTIKTEPSYYYKVMFDKRHVGDSSDSGVMVTTFDGTGNASSNAYWGASYWGQDKAMRELYFKAKGTTTTIQFRDFNYSGTSHDVFIDDIEVRKVSDIMWREFNVAGWATAFAQDTYYSASYPAVYGVDGVPDNFMHTAGTASLHWYEMTFHQVFDITKIRMVPRDGYLNRTGETVRFYNGQGGEVGNVTLGDSSYIYDRSSGWSGIKKIRVEEDGDGVALNFAELEVYSLVRMGKHGLVIFIK